MTDAYFFYMVHVLVLLWLTPDRYIRKYINWPKKTPSQISLLVQKVLMSRIVRTKSIATLIKNSS